MGLGGSDSHRILRLLKIDHNAFGDEGLRLEAWSIETHKDF